MFFGTGIQNVLIFCPKWKYTVPMRLEYSVSPVLRQKIEAIGQTEDVRLSPNGQRLALAVLHRRLILVLDLALSPAPARERVAITGMVEIHSPEVNYPHGLDFIDEHHLVVANRGGTLVVLPLPPGDESGYEAHVQPIAALPEEGKRLVRAPGSVFVSAGRSVGQYLVTICNGNDTVSQHTLETDGEIRFTRHQTLLKKWLDTPDGLAWSEDYQWIAVSNHNTHNVLVYKVTPELGVASDPVALLRGLRYPHGVRFSSDGRTLYVADAGAPYVRLFHAQSGDWSGVYQPQASVRVIEHSLFLKGNRDPGEGGPKGLDYSSQASVLITTSEMQPLGFFDINAVDSYQNSELEEQALREDALWTELTIMHRFVALKSSLSWKITAPLRRALDSIVLTLRKLRSAVRRPLDKP